MFSRISYIFGYIKVGGSFISFLNSMGMNEKLKLDVLREEELVWRGI